MARRRKAGPRTKSGRLSRAYKTIAADHGTPQIQAKREAALAGAPPIDGSGTPPDRALAASALGILLAYGHVTAEQHSEALRYRVLHCAKFGPIGLANSQGGEATDARLVILEERLAEYERHLSRDERETLVWVACADHIPYWFDCLRLKLKLRPEDERERALLISALDALIHARSGDRRKRAA
jgi:hypothetical protein